MRTLALVLLLGAALPGCSWMFVEAPPAGHHHLRYFDCTSSRAAPIVDTTLAAIYGLSAVTMAARYAAADEARSATLPYLLVPVAAATVFGLSAGHGFSATSECDDAKEAWARRVIERPPPPRASTPRPCGSDGDCAGDRICEQGACVFPVGPPALPAPPPTSPPVPTTVPVPAPEATVPAPAPTVPAAPTQPASPASAPTQAPGATPPP